MSGVLCAGKESDRGLRRLREGGHCPCPCPFPCWKAGENPQRGGFSLFSEVRFICVFFFACENLSLFGRIPFPSQDTKIRIFFLYPGSQRVGIFLVFFVHPPEAEGEGSAETRCKAWSRVPDTTTCPGLRVLAPVPPVPPSSAAGLANLQDARSHPRLLPSAFQLPAGRAGAHWVREL